MVGMGVMARTVPTARQALPVRLASVASLGLPALEVPTARPACAASQGLEVWLALLARKAKPASAGLVARPGDKVNAGPSALFLLTAGAAPRCSSNGRTASGERRST